MPLSFKTKAISLVVSPSSISIVFLDLKIKRGSKIENKIAIATRRGTTIRIILLLVFASVNIQDSFRE